MLTFAVYHTREGLMELRPLRAWNADVPLDVAADLFEEWNMTVQARAHGEPYTAVATHCMSSCGPGRIVHLPVCDHELLSVGELAAIGAARGTG